MGWQTEATGIDEHGQAEPPEGDGWEPIGAHDGKVIWRRRVFTHAEVQTTRHLVELLGEMVEHLWTEQAELQHDACVAIAKLEQELEVERRKRMPFDAINGPEAHRLYMRGYNVKHKREPDRAQQALLEENAELCRRLIDANELPPFLQGIA